MGSTAPLRLPRRNERQRELPSARMGMEMMAPSGMFWMAIPNDTATAEAMEMFATPCSAPAKTTPTAIPSGRLWMVTAKANIAVRDSLERGPSGWLLPMCKWGVTSSISNKKPIPNRKPTAAGNTDHAPFPSSISMAGMSSDQTEAATITPDAKPSKDFCTRSGMSFFIKNTKAEPSIVPSKGISNPIAIVGINKERG